MKRRLHDTLEQFWGYSSFRPLQEDIINAVLEGKDTLGLMPTGGGKSITFQVPAMIKEGICLVITPLIALMKDQVDNLRTRGIKATTVYSGMTSGEINKHLDNCIYGDYKFLYISPERLHTQLFKSKLSMMNVSMLVVDESHCISQWGYDFRPSYLHIAQIRKELPENVPVLALTATATPEVIEDIQEKLLFRKKHVLKKSFNRENLAYIVRSTENKIEELTHILKKVAGPAIVYVRNRKNTQEITRALQQQGISANFFHAGLNKTEKNDRQDTWKKDMCRVMVSTNAFGMGIDKPDVRLVVHMDMPGSLEEYFQEAGRAGRDEQKAYAIALCSSNETGKLKKRLSNEFPERKIILRIYESLCNYCQIAVGFGKFTTHNFSLPGFCKVFKFPIIQTHSALKILESAGYIEYIEDPENNSRLLFTVNRDELYKMNFDPFSESVIRTILRSYTGIFADFVFIDEAFIATHTHSTREAVYDALTMLSKARVINYIPQKKQPQVIFTDNRQEAKHIKIPHGIFERRREQIAKRILKVSEYISDPQSCRTRLLLHYFGENTDKNCQVCDRCLRKTQSGLKNWEYETIRSTLMQKLKNKTNLSIQNLSGGLPLEKEKNLQAIRFIVDNEDWLKMEDGMIFMSHEN